jgi:leader peptidase (prepilin peptidase)/N-methyltransferase
MQEATIAVPAVLGLAIGSFLNVVIWRVPRKLSVLRPRSRCPTCETPISPIDNVPLVSWLLLGGKCRHCAAPISIRYPLVEVGCAVLFGAAGARFGWTGELPAYLVLFAALLTIPVIDLEHNSVPDRILARLSAVAVPLLGLAAVGEGDGKAFARVLVAGVMAFGGMLVVKLVFPRGMGLGDVEMSFVLGLYLGWLGWGEVMLAILLAFLLGTVIRIGLISLRLRSHRDFIPFGPFLALGTVVTVLWGEPILRWFTEA